VEHRLHIFKSLDAQAQTVEAKQLAKEIALSYESVIALEWANRYGGKYEKLAELFIEDAWGLRKVGDRMKTVEWYEDII